ncbi:MAG TPA: FG-GAP-like repeat-containing protein [Candidatus Saccharimonadales bacterium]|nr:FG-GAP-like repeat-containing protein [Candidatus Saccharimonadales bacterium]
MRLEQLPTTSEQTVLPHKPEAVLEKLRFNLGRLAAASALTLASLVGLEATSPIPAQADSVSTTYSDLGYPWKDAPCEFGSAGGATCTNPKDPSDKYDWGEYINGAFQQYRNGAFEYRNCTDWTAYRINQVSGGKVTVPGSFGNGGQWYANAPSSERSGSPKAWDAAVVPGNPGHVAFVESVNSVDPGNPLNDNITVSEYNHDAQGDGDERTGRAGDMGFTEFVDFGVHPSSTSPLPNSPKPRDDLVAFQPSTASYVQGSSLGNGQFNWGGTNLTHMTTPSEFKLGDINGDNKADIVDIEASGGVARYMVGTSQGNAHFNWQYTNLKNMTVPTHFALGDLNNDNKDDIIAFEQTSPGVGRYMQGTSNGDGNFTWAYTNLKNMGTPNYLELGDINGDHKADIVAVEPTSNGVRYMVGFNQGNERYSWDYSNLVSMAKPTGFELADINGDNKDDIIAFEPTGNGFGQYMIGNSQGDGRFSWQHTNLSNMGIPSSFAAGDINGDGDADIVAFESTGANTGRYMRGIGQGNGVFAWDYTNLTSEPKPSDIELGDFTGN